MSAPLEEYNEIWLKNILLNLPDIIKIYQKNGFSSPLSPLMRNGNNLDKSYNINKVVLINSHGLYWNAIPLINTQYQLFNLLYDAKNGPIYWENQNGELGLNSDNYNNGDELPLLIREKTKIVSGGTQEFFDLEQLEQQDNETLPHVIRRIDMYPFSTLSGEGNMNLYDFYYNPSNIRESGKERLFPKLIKIIFDYLYANSENEKIVKIPSYVVNMSIDTDNVNLFTLPTELKTPIKMALRGGGEGKEIIKEESSTTTTTEPEPKAEPEPESEPKAEPGSESEPKTEPEANEENKKELSEQIEKLKVFEEPPQLSDRIKSLQIEEKPEEKEQTGGGDGGGEENMVGNENENEDVSKVDIPLPSASASISAEQQQRPNSPTQSFRAVTVQPEKRRITYYNYKIEDGEGSRNSHYLSDHSKIPFYFKEHKFTTVNHFICVQKLHTLTDRPIEYICMKVSYDKLAKGIKKLYKKFNITDETEKKWTKKLFQSARKLGRLLKMKSNRKLEEWLKQHRECELIGYDNDGSVETMWNEILNLETETES